MKLHRSRRCLTRLLLVLLLVGGSSDSQATYPPQGDDVIPSLGSFRLRITTKYAPLFVGYPGFNATTLKLQSPTLFDSGTVIGRSSPYLINHPGSTATVRPVGSAGTLLCGDAALCAGAGPTLFPLPPPYGGFNANNGEQAILTEVAMLFLSPGGGGGMPTVRAGSMAPLQGVSPGIVEEKAPGTDFPAESFFDVNVEVDIPDAGSWGADMTVYNSIPLFVQNANLMALPPSVIYIHGNTQAVPVRFLTTNFPLWVAGDLLGWLVLAGHGANMDQSVQGQFEDFMSQQPEMPLPPDIPTLASEGAMMVLVTLLIGSTALLLVVWSGRRVARRF